MKSEVVIREVAGLKRALRLVGSGLPKQGAAWGGKQRLVTTWYPGNGAQASQQVLGPTENQTPMNGVWRTTQLTRTPAVFEGKPGAETKIAFADSLREIFEDMLRGGALLQVYWINAEAQTFGARSIYRVGRAADWNFAYDRMDDIVWSVTWDWTSRGLNQQKVTEFRDDPTNAQQQAQFQAVATALADAIDGVKLKASKRTVPLSANKFSLEQLGQLLDAPKNLMRDFGQSMNRISNRVNHLSGLINKAKGMPYEVGNQFLDACLTAVQASNGFYDAMTQKPPELLETQSTLASLTRAASYAKGVTDTSAIVASKSNELAQSIRAQIQVRRVSGASGNAFPPPGPATASSLAGDRTQVETHIVKQGETLLSISQKFYGLPEGAYGIAFSNGLSLKEIPRVGKVLIIPPLNAGPSKLLVTTPVAASGGLTTLPSGNIKLPGSP